MKTTVISAIFIFLMSVIFAQEPSDALKNITTKLSVYSQNLPLEKVYLEPDKDIYNPGEIVWFKAVVFDRSTQKLSTLSKELVIKLFDNKGDIITSDYYLLENGQTNGDIKLPEDLPRGRYYISAFTTLQFNIENTFNRLIYVDQVYKSDLIVTVLNEDEIFDTEKDAKILVEVKSLKNEPEPRLRLNYEVYIEQEQIENGKVRTDANGKVEIGFKFPDETGELPLRVVIWEEKNYWEKTIPVKTGKDRILLEFYPEGGNAISGLPQKTGFVSFDIFGNPVSVEGDIIDKDGTLIAKCKSFTNGFGLVPVQYKTEEKYRLKITSNYGKGQIFDLPSPGKDNFTIAALSNDEDFVNTYLSCPVGEEHKIILTLTSGYKLAWAGELTISKPARFKIPVNECPDGIAMISAFNMNEELIGQRLIYIDRKTNLNLNVKTALQNNIEAQISASDAGGIQITGQSIVSVASKNRFFENENSIYNYLKFNSEFKNSVQDNTITNPENNMSRTAIDYILISNKLRGFSWNGILNFNSSDIKYVKDNLMGITGRVTGKYGSSIQNAIVRLTDSRTSETFTQTSDNEGIFTFLSVDPADKQFFTISASDREGKNEYNVKIVQSFDELLGKYIRRFDLQNSAIDVPREKLIEFISLNENTILNAPVKPVKVTRQFNEPAYKQLLKSSTSLLEVIKSIKPFSLSGDAIIFPGMLNSINSQMGAIIVVDGQQLGKSSSVLDNYNPLDIEEINVYTDPVNSQKYTGFASGGLIEIFTKKAEIAPVQQDEESQEENLYMNGYRIPREYNSVTNLLAEKENKLKSTLYWNPDLNIESGQSSRLFIPLSELKTDYIIRITVLDSSGGVGNYRSEIGN
ncbi:MAG: hypothetical protein JXR31_14225 [Prolixibacteraceae bacterium]|nr:hypothetical protein [Prolixibacteraceae bacterium]MBN2775407.1 hypothetical protein [Prolixibacteraceae bacterium]